MLVRLDAIQTAMAINYGLTGGSLITKLVSFVGNCRLGAASLISDFSIRSSSKCFSTHS